MIMNGQETRFTSITHWYRFVLVYLTCEEHFDVDDGHFVWEFVWRLVVVFLGKIIIMKVLVIVGQPTKPVFVSGVPLRVLIEPLALDESVEHLQSHQVHQLYFHGLPEIHNRLGLELLDIAPGEWLDIWICYLAQSPPPPPPPEQSLNKTAAAEC